MASEWFFLEAGVKQGPLTSPQLRALVAEGVITPSTLVWKEGLPDWTAASKIGGLFEAGAESGPMRPEARQQPVDAPARASAGEKLPLADRILRTGFAIGRWMSIAVVVVAIGVITIGSLSYSAALVPTPAVEEPDLERPTAASFVSRCIAEQQEEARAESRRNLDPDGRDRGRSQSRQAVDDIGRPDECGTYRVRIRDVLAHLQIDNVDGKNEAVLCGTIESIDASERDWFIDTFVEFAKKWRSSDEADRELCSGVDAANWFIASAKRALETKQSRLAQLELEWMAAEQERARRRTVAVQLLGGGLVGLMVFLVIPLLIQIERNTRPARSATR